MDELLSIMRHLTLLSVQIQRRVVHEELCGD